MVAHPASLSSFSAFLSLSIVRRNLLGPELRIGRRHRSSLATVTMPEATMYKQGESVFWKDPNQDFLVSLSGAVESDSLLCAMRCVPSFRA